MEDTADNEHHGHHPGCSEEKRLATAEIVDTCEQEDTSGDDFDRSVDTSGEEGSIGLGDTDSLEDLRCVVSTILTN